MEEEILQLAESEIANVKFKEIITPAIYEFIAYVNKSLATNKDTNGFDKYLKKLKLIIGGGAAFNYYIKRNKNTRILNTHDFDLRLYLDIKPSESPLFTADGEDISKWMMELTNSIALSFAEFLNGYVEQIDLTKKFPTLTTFYMVNHGFLKTIEYEIDDENDSLIDIVPHIPRTAIHYGALNIQKEMLFDQYKQPDQFNVASRQGFVKSDIIYVKGNKNLYFVSLGYLVWDTVRMLNYIIDSVGQSSIDKTIKFERYLYKYKILLAALSHPEQYLSCKASKKFISSCSNNYQVCRIDGKSIRSKRTLVNIGMKKGILPRSSEWYEAFLKMDFSDICKAILESNTKFTKY